MIPAGTLPTPYVTGALNPLTGALRVNVAPKPRRPRVSADEWRHWEAAYSANDGKMTESDYPCGQPEPVS